MSYPRLNMVRLIVGFTKDPGFLSFNAWMANFLS